MSTSKPDPEKYAAPSSMLLDEETLKRSEDDARRLSRSWADSFLGHKKHHTKRWKILTVLVALSGLLVFPVLGVWFKYGFKLAYNGDYSAANSTVTGQVLGGSFSQSEAKAVDIAFSALVAPMMMAGLNYVWFTSARVSVVNELDSGRRGVPLASLVGASISSGGSYDPWLIWTLLQGRTWRLLMFGTLVLFSAIAKSAWTNVIAYAAVPVILTKENAVSLRLLSDEHLNEVSYAPGSNAINLDSFSMKKQSDLASQITGLFTGLNFLAASTTLPAQLWHDGPYDEMGYSRPNATRSSMSLADPSINHLIGVPAIFITVQCLTTQPNMITVSQMGTETTVISAFYEDAEFQAYYPGGIGEIQTSMNDVYQYAGFNLNNTEVFLGYLTSFNLSGGSIPTPYGIIEPQAQNMTPSGFSGTKEVMSYWGIRCSLFRRESVLNLTLYDSLWQVDSSGWNFTEQKQIPSLLSQWQTNLNYRAPGSTLPGIGPALARTAGVTNCSVSETELVTCDNGTDFVQLANNFLYASGEVERIVHEVTLSGEKSIDFPYDHYTLIPMRTYYDPADSPESMPSKWYSSSALVNTDVYKITYVPAVLFIGLSACLIAALLTTSMALYTARTWSAKTFRQMDPLRLVVDCGEGLQEDIRAMGVLQSLPNASLSKWAAARMVRYSRAEDGMQRRIRLQPARDGS